MHQQLGYEFQELKGNDTNPYLALVAEFRIKYFRDYPYLYVGSLEYEKEYLSGFAANPHSHLIIARDQDDKVVGLSTAVPLQSESAILTQVADYFKRTGRDLDRYFYYGEVIVSPNHRGSGLVRQFYEIHEKFACFLGFKSALILTVSRGSNDPRRPHDYRDGDLVFSRLGFSKLGLSVGFQWPTIQPNGATLNQENIMDLWEKVYDSQ